MRSQKYFIFLMILLFAFAMQAQAQSHSSSYEAQIQEWIDHWTKAFHEGNVDAIMALYSPDVIAYDIVPPLQFIGAQAYRKDYIEFLAQYNGPVDVEVRDLHIFADREVAFAQGLERFSGTLKSGEKSDLWLRFTSGFRKINGKWLNVHDHVSVPTDFETGKSRLDLKP